jgi:hypothetical protein
MYFYRDDVCKLKSTVRDEVNYTDMSIVFGTSLYACCTLIP